MRLIFGDSLCPLADYKDISLHTSNTMSLLLTISWSYNYVKKKGKENDLRQKAKTLVSTTLASYISSFDIIVISLYDGRIIFW